MRLILDQGCCEGHGRCYDLAPGLIEPDDDGRAVLVEGGHLRREDEPDAQLAVRNCPERALSLGD